MEIGFLSYLFAMLVAGIGGFGGGIGGVNIMKQFGTGWVDRYFSNLYDLNPGMDKELIAMAANMETEILNIASVSQYGGYTQGITLAAYLGSYTPLGIFGGILGGIAFMLPSVLMIAVILKIGERLYKSSSFRYSVKYINLFAAGLICMIALNYIFAIFAADPILYVAVAGLACFFNIYFRVNPAIIVAVGGIIGMVVQRMD